jgi:hypothetical protein
MDSKPPFDALKKAIEDRAESIKFPSWMPSQAAWILAFLSWPLAKLMEQLPAILDLFIVKRPLAKKDLALAKKELEKWEFEKEALISKAQIKKKGRKQ